MKKFKLSKFLVIPMALIVVIGMSDAAMAHEQGKREHRHPDKEYTSKYRHLDNNPKYHPLKVPHYKLVKVPAHHGKWRGQGNAYGHHHKPVKYVYVPAHRHNKHKHGYPHSGYSIKYFGDNFSIGFRDWH